jgi:hypothetical protein
MTCSLKAPSHAQRRAFFPLPETEADFLTFACLLLLPNFTTRLRSASPRTRCLVYLALSALPASTTLFVHLIYQRRPYLAPSSLLDTPASSLHRTCAYLSSWPPCSPTAATAHNGTPLAAGINFAVRAPADPHAHGHGPSLRSDPTQVPKWASNLRNSNGVLSSRSGVNGKSTISPSPATAS